ncbi:unnamed protein product [Discula destructiva]
MAPIRLRHIHLPCSSSDGLYPTYKTAAAVQELLRRRLLDFKDAEISSSSPRSPPHPTLISFTPQPTYTLGRRQASPSSSSLSPADIERLKAPLHIPSSHPLTPLPALGKVPIDNNNNNNNKTAPNAERTFHPSVLTSPRGGLATYHGPGQVVLWPVMVINSSHPSTLGYKPFSVRCYSRLLESTTIALLRRLFGLRAFTTDDPGVWVGGGGGGGGGGSGPRKIAALGIHLRRHVSSLGAALNLDMPTMLGSATTAAEEKQLRANPWARFVACGLEGKGVTCVEEELRAAGGQGIGGIEGELVARAWAEELAVRMELDPQSVEFVKGDEAEDVVRVAEREGWMDVVARDELR